MKTAVLPLVITQANSEAAFGLEPRRFLQLVQEHRIPLLPALAKTKIRAVKAADLLAALESTQPGPASEQESQFQRLARAAGI